MSFLKFPNLPTELRLEIWREYFTDCHGTQIHIFHSTPQGPRYTNQDAASGLPGHNTLAAAKVSAESWDVFREFFNVGDTRNLQPQSSLLDARGRLIDHHDDDEAGTDNSQPPSLRAIYATAAREELRRQTVEFAFAQNDMFYIVDKDVTPLLVSLSSAPWARHVRHLAVQILNFVAYPALFHEPGFRLDRWARWDALLSAPPESVCRFLEGLVMGQLLFVVVPGVDVRHYRYLKPNTHGFVVVDSENFIFGSQDECRVVRSHARVVYARFCEAFPDLKGKIGSVIDAVPDRAEFSIYS
ncbi:hypothetical protein FHL15_005320 [Xylaria flabelliformis]|uniref:2EXR domain-containing protein n=1 Tax=Xylaria flabelliformis TaxID=2512241 RepID=A0A553I0B1_9PEZI|nr:hypothetical protein FHL15_005320 [Xylaria flabelliformis]